MTAKGYVPPPPTRFGPVQTASANRQGVAAVQAKVSPNGRAVVPPPPTRYGAPAVQHKAAPTMPTTRPTGAVQRMESGDPHYLSLASFMTRVRTEGMQHGMCEIGANGNYADWDQTFTLRDGGLFTDYMGSCVTVGLTVPVYMVGNKIVDPDTQGAQPARLNALHHSFSEVDPDPGKAIVKSLTNRIADDYGGNFKDIQDDAKFFIVGGVGRPPSIRKTESIDAYLYKKEYNIGLSRVMTSSGFDGLTKAVMVTASGDMLYTYYSKAKAIHYDRLLDAMKKR